MYVNDPKSNPTFDQLRGDPLAGDSTRGFFTASDGLKMFYEYWAPKDRKPDKVVVGFHGMAAHSRYLCVMADQLVPHGAAMAVLDLRGHGLTEGRQGDILDPMQIIDDAKKFCAFVREDLFPGAKLYTLGESMGGAINVLVNVDPPEGIAGMVLLAPAIAPAYSFTAKQIVLGIFYMLTYLVSPGSRVVKVTGDEARGMRDPLNIKYDQEDPFHLKYVSPRFLLRVKAIVDRARAEGTAITAPTLVIQGGKDVAVSHEAVKKFVGELAATDKTFKFFPDAPHCMMNDPEIRGELRTMVRDWILAH